MTWIALAISVYAALAALWIALKKQQAVHVHFGKHKPVDMDKRWEKCFDITSRKQAGRDDKGRFVGSGKCS